MVKIGSVWDSTTDVLAGRAALLVPLAALAFFLPAVLQNALMLYGGTSPGVAVAGLFVGIAALLISVWGQLATLAIASDPSTTLQTAGQRATRRLPADLLILLVLGGLTLLLIVPIVIALSATGYDFAALAAWNGTDDLPPLAPGAAAFVALYALVLVVGGLWVMARLFLVNAVVLNERRGIGAIGRSVQLTRGLTLKLIGVAVLFIVVFLVAFLAAKSVVGLVARLLLGPANITTAQFLAAIAGAALTASFTVVVQVFAARLYAAVCGYGQDGAGQDGSAARVA